MQLWGAPSYAVLPYLQHCNFVLSNGLATFAEFFLNYPYLIIDWERLGSTGGPLRSGPRSGTGLWGQYKTPGMLGFIRAQRGRARSALFSRVRRNSDFHRVWLLHFRDSTKRPSIQRSREEFEFFFSLKCVKFCSGNESKGHLTLAYSVHHGKIVIITAISQ